MDTQDNTKGTPEIKPTEGATSSPPFGSPLGSQFSTPPVSSTPVSAEGTPGGNEISSIITRTRKRTGISSSTSSVESSPLHSAKKRQRRNSKSYELSPLQLSDAYLESKSDRHATRYRPGNPQLKLPENVEVKTSNKGKTAIRKKIEPSKPFDRQEILNSSV